MSDHRVPLHKLAAAIRAHSIFSPSGSFMWANCHGSLIPNIQMPDDSGYEAAEGTVGHGVGETWLNSGQSPDHLLGTVETVVRGEGDDQQIFKIPIDAAMLSHVERYVDWCAFLPGEHFVETRVDFSDLTPIPNQGGTADHAACEFGKLTITDLKYGIGVKVYALNNTQAILYAYGFFREYDWYYDFKTIVIRIAQPRLDHFDEWTITREELLDWAEWLKEQAFAAWRYDAPRVPGEKQCQWCRIKPSCKAFAVWMDRLTSDIFDNLDDPITKGDMNALVAKLEDGTYEVHPEPVDELTIEHKVAIFNHRKLIVNWLDDIGADLYRRLDRGEQVPDYKLVDGKKSRSFTNEADTIEELDFLGLDIDAVKPRVMRSPAQIEEELIKVGYKRKQLPLLLDPLVRRTPGKPTMVKSGDARPSLAAFDEGIFTDIDDEL